MLRFAITESLATEGSNKSIVSTDRKSENTDLSSGYLTLTHITKEQVKNLS